jgi:hypothetical protein
MSHHFFQTSLVLIAIFVCTLLYLVFFAVQTNSLFSLALKAHGKLQTTHVNSTTLKTNWHFVLAGEWGDTGQTEKTVRNIETKVKNLELVIGLGDYSYFTKGDMTGNTTANPFGKKFVGTLGELDVRKSDFYNRLFGLNIGRHSFNHKGIHFLSVDTEGSSLSSSNSWQYKFIKSELDKAQEDPAIKWIVIFLHRPMYAAVAPLGPDIKNIRLLHPLFDNYSKIAIVVQGYNGNFQRSYPLFYNIKNPYYPFITNSSNRDYLDPCGQIYLVVGTAGGSSFGFANKPYYMSLQKQDSGFLDIEVKDNGNILTGMFYSNANDKVNDFFTIRKHGDAKLQQGLQKKCLENKDVLSKTAKFPNPLQLLVYLYGVNQSTGPVAIFINTGTVTDGSVVNASAIDLSDKNPRHGIDQTRLAFPNIQLKAESEYKVCALVIKKLDLVCYIAKYFPRMMEQTVNLVLGRLTKQQ